MVISWQVTIDDWLITTCQSWWLYRGDSRQTDNWFLTTCQLWRLHQNEIKFRNWVQDQGNIFKNKTKTKSFIWSFVRDFFYIFFFSVALHPQRPCGLLGTGSPGRPPRLSHSSWASMLPYVHRDHKDYQGSGAQDVYLDFHTAPELWAQVFCSVLFYVHRDYKDY